MLQRNQTDPNQVKVIDDQWIRSVIIPPVPLS